MTDSYSIGDIVVSSLVIQSPRKNIDLTGSFLSFSMYESIFTPGIILDVDILDTTDLLGSAVLIGDETVVLVASIPNGSKFNMVFHLDSLTGLQSQGAQKSKTYTLKCVSVEAFFGMRNPVRTGYSNKSCSDIVKDLHTNFIKSSKPIDVESTDGTVGPLAIPNLPAFKAIQMVREMSVSSTNKSSIFSYFETRDSGKQKFKYVTIESLFRNQPVKNFTQYDAVNIDSKIDRSNNILSYKIPYQFSTMDKMKYAGPRDQSVKDRMTQQYNTQVMQTNDTSYATGGGKGTNISTSFFNNFLNLFTPPKAMYDTEYANRAISLVPDKLKDRMAYLSILMQNTMRIAVPGDLSLTSGVMINCNIPNKTGLTVNVSQDPLMTGNFLIARIHHRVTLKQDRPRYTCVIECMKGKYEQGV